MAVPPQLAGFAVMAAIFFALSTTALALRLWVRRTITHNIGGDDYTLVVSHLINIAAGTVWLYYHITGFRFPADSQELASYISMPEVVATALVLTASALAKTAVAMFLLKVAHKRWERWAIMTPLCMYITALVLTMLIILFRCGLPIDGTRIITADNCPIPRNIFNTVGCMIAVVNTVCDWSFAFVPMHMVWTATRIDSTSKLSAVIIIILAFSGSFISFARVPFFARGDSFEPTTVYKTAPILLLSVVENAVVITLISAATLRPLVGAIRNGSSSRRPSLPMAFRRGRLTINSHSGEVVAVQQSRRSRSFTPDWSFMRGIGILPDVGHGRTIHYADDEGYVGVRKPPREVTVKVTQMASIDEVVNSTAGGSGTHSEKTDTTCTLDKA